MTDAERIDHLIKILEGDNAVVFSKKCGIPTASLSRARNGKANARFYFPKILKAYPSVRMEWLYEENGEPLQKSDLMNKIDDLEKEIRRLADIMQELNNTLSTRKSTRAPKYNAIEGQKRTPSMGTKKSPIRLIFNRLGLLCLFYWRDIDVIIKTMDWMSLNYKKRLQSKTVTKTTMKTMLRKHPNPSHSEDSVVIFLGAVYCGEGGGVNS